MKAEYNAEDILVLEGLEPVRKRPGMYIGGTDDNALHHLVNEVFDNAMDEAVAGFASKIEITLDENNFVIISDNGRGIPVDPHPKFKNKSALEVILTTLHSGGKFSNKVYNTSGGLHGVGLSVVNALSDELIVEVIRNKTIYKQKFSKGLVISPLEGSPSKINRTGTTIKFHPDAEIFSNIKFNAKRLYELAKSKAYLFKGVEIFWKCSAQEYLEEVPDAEKIHFPQGLRDYLSSVIETKNLLIDDIFTGEIETKGENKEKIEWALGFIFQGKSFFNSYCNTISTPLGGSHETGFRSALLKSIKAYGENVNNKKVSLINNEDIADNICAILSVFIQEPQFQGQTKEKLISIKVNKFVDNMIKDHFDHYLANNQKNAEKIINYLIKIAENRIARRDSKETARKTIIQKIRLPGKLADCASGNKEETEIFLVEGDSAGGSAKQARERNTQAILPLRGKVLNVASASKEKIRLNQELNDLELALGCGKFDDFDEEKLRYGKIIIMTDADVDGAHISSLLMTYFFICMPKLIELGRLYLAQPPLYKITIAGKNYYARSENEKKQILLKAQDRKIEMSRFKGLGEMLPAQLKDTTMNPKTRQLIKISLPENINSTYEIVNNLMGKKPELRFNYIQEQAQTRGSQIIEKLDL